MVKALQVCLLKSANKAVTTPVYVWEGDLNRLHMLFDGHDYVPAVSMVRMLLNTNSNSNGYFTIIICNEMGFTEKIPKDYKIYS